MERESDGPSVRVFVIEGDKPLVSLLVWGLCQEGIDAVSAPPPDEATDGYGGRGASLVVINADLPREGRARWISAIRMSSPSVAIIDLPHDGDDATEADASLKKPYQMEKLLRLVRSLNRFD